MAGKAGSVKKVDRSTVATEGFEDALSALEVALEDTGATVKVYRARRQLSAELRLLVRAFDARLASLEEKAGLSK